MNVFKKAFSSLHGISHRRVDSILHRSRLSTTSPQDKRGKHTNRPNRINRDIITQIDQHICSFPSKSSHYSRHDNHHKRYLSESLPVAKMHCLYLEKFEPVVAAEQSLSGEVKPLVKYEFYRERFNNHHNFSFGCPRSDTCPTCDEFELKIKEATDSTVKATLEAKRQLHHRKAERFYESLREHTSLAREDTTVATLSFDFQQNLPSPVLPVGEIFYARQLWLYNFGIHDCATNAGTMYVWDESTAKRGSNEVASCLLHYITNNLSEDVDTLHLFLDGCGGQSKNYTIFWFLYSLVKLQYLKRIVHCYPILGHSFLPCDRDFALVEVNK